MLAVAPTFDDLVQARIAKARQKSIAAAQRVAAGEIPQCKWAGHRYHVVREDAVQVVEFCMDCGGRGRVFPSGKTSKDAKPYLGAA